VKPKAEAEQSTVSQTPAVKNARTTWEYHRVLDLKMGDVLVFEEAIGPNTGQAADADPRHRHVVRLTGVKEAVDELYHQPVLEIAWAAEDALPFPLCLSVVGPVSTGCQLIENVSVARGNIVLVDHGRWTADDDPDEKLWTVPARCITQTCQGIGDPAVIVAEPARFRPVLQKGPLTFSQPLLASSSAAAIMEQDPRQALPCLELKSIPPAPLAAPDPQRVVPLFRPHDLKDPTNLAKRLRAPQAEGVVSIYLRSLLSAATQTALDQYDGADTLPADLHNGLITDLGGLLREWTARADLLASQADDPHYVTELDNRERAHLRFGDGELGFQPEAGTAFVARYRVGNGLAGNVGADAICHLVFRQTTVSGGVLAVRNPLPAQGGRAAETLAEVKRFAPYAFRSDLQRAISPDDCTQLVLRQFGSQVQRARVTLRWTGSWYEMLVAIDQLGQVEADEGLLADIARYLERYRRIGYDLVVKAARYVPLEIKLKVCVKPAYLRGHVMAVLLDLFSNRRLPDGRLGFFHPDNLTFGQGIRLSSLVALAQSAPGVTSVEVAKLQRYDAQPSGEIAQGILPLGPFEIARLDNDAAFPEHGLFELEMEGGR
ncbi:MAG: putative baseplate assembly protein, partial [Chloroflexi bacterium]|nr:putative baseplate assembly protein [Chloroflexota bacterium]